MEYAEGQEGGSWRRAVEQRKECLKHAPPPQRAAECARLANGPHSLPRECGEFFRHSKESACQLAGSQAEDECTQESRTVGWHALVGNRPECAGFAPEYVREEVFRVAHAEPGAWEAGRRGGCAEAVEKARGSVPCMFNAAPAQCARSYAALTPACGRPELPECPICRSTATLGTIPSFQ
jgi:hypothetical protein